MITAATEELQRLGGHQRATNTNTQVAFSKLVRKSDVVSSNDGCSIRLCNVAEAHVRRMQMIYIPGRQGVQAVPVYTTPPKKDAVPKKTSVKPKSAQSAQPSNLARFKNWQISWYRLDKNAVSRGSCNNSRVVSSASCRKVNPIHPSIRLDQVEFNPTPDLVVGFGGEVSCPGSVCGDGQRRYYLENAYDGRCGITLAGVVHADEKNIALLSQNKCSGQQDKWKYYVPYEADDAFLFIKTYLLKD